MIAYITVTCKPDNATNKTAIWSISGTNPVWKDTDDSNKKQIVTTGSGSTTHSYSKTIITADDVTRIVQAIHEPADDGGRAWSDYTILQ